MLKLYLFVVYIIKIDIVLLYFSVVKILELFPLCFRKNELHQVAQQASNIEDLTEVVRASLTIMAKQWSDAMHTFHEKFDSLSTLITDHGSF